MDDEMGAGSFVVPNRVGSLNSAFGRTCLEQISKGD